MWIAILISVITIVLIMLRPKPLNEGTAAAMGAFLMLGSSQVLPQELPALLQDIAPILLFFLGLMLICVVAEKAGFFQWSAYQAVKLSKGRGWLLFFTIFALGTGITAFFFNDATALLLTPVVFTLVSELKLNPLPYVFTCAFIANTASLLLPVSNPVNLLPFTAFHLTLGEYLHYLLLPSIAAIAVNIAVFYFLFRHKISARFEASNLTCPPKDFLFKYTCTVLVVIAIAYLVVSFYGLPLFWVALGGALLLVGGGLALHLRPHEIRSGIFWSILLFIFSLSVVVKGLGNSGVITALGNTLSHSFPQGSLRAIAAVSLGSALGSNFINNWAMMMVSVSSLASANSHPDSSLIYGAILGADIGPNLTIVGSLSSMLWLAILRQRGLNISPWQYFKVGIVLTPVMLAASILSLYAVGQLSGQ
ncbi:MAG: arsenic transporter [Chloroflexi bacterium CG_4_10_14_0_8_um_filter_46_9]|nr:MAG: arsenic transporter [Chloroflexi bacterium CG_4_10_14_0_8_um_filter_46_9]